MKKKLFGILFIAALAVVVLNKSMSKEDNGMSDLMLDNVEALAGGDITWGPWYCVGNYGYCFFDSEGPIYGIRH